MPAESPGKDINVATSSRASSSTSMTVQAVRQTEQQLRRLLETLNVVPWEADAVTWQFTYVGPQVEKLLGYPVTRWYEKDFWAEHLFAADRERAIEFCLQHSQTDDQYEFDYRMHG